jgi:competence ComEA-like helix-hairpin-helix protein
MASRSFAIRFLLSVCLLFGAPAFAKKKPPAQPVNINAATSEELQLVPGIGPSTAEKILQMRKSYGPFKSVDDLLAIRGLGPKRLEKMRKYFDRRESSCAKAHDTFCEVPSCCRKAIRESVSVAHVLHKT